jgi:hypothetical protein
MLVAIHVLRRRIVRGKSATPVSHSPETIGSGVLHAKLGDHWTEQIRAILVDRFGPRAIAWTTEEISARRSELSVPCGTEAADGLIRLARLADEVKFAGRALDASTVAQVEQELAELRTAQVASRNAAPA